MLTDIRSYLVGSLFNLCILRFSSNIVNDLIARKSVIHVIFVNSIIQGAVQK